MDIDLTVDRLEANYQRGYKHIDNKGRHIAALFIEDIATDLDGALAFRGINEPDIFLERLHRIVAHQTYHVPVDRIAGMNYGAMTRVMDHGRGNPRIEVLERILNAIGVSVALCKIEDREAGIAADKLQRACFYEDTVKRDERWFLINVIEVFHAFGLQLRIFKLDDVEENNEFNYQFSSETPSLDAKELREARKRLEHLTELLRFFNVKYEAKGSYRLSLSLSHGA